ncbi:hypothetical protein [Actinomadura bangladeshensis]|uniref:Uncharacterized protein n=1 Tax=Actinomadura bangladeshensis TaxID=453573 RepID=A0A4R4NFI8_9ACTN|nr:hypothetical protein [Actinomadura bangladeshensis]TDC07194.1 hypothetical protein E1284_32720 [Actinomadura bangladeshensis]
MSASEYWVDGRRKRAVTIRGTGGWEDDRESRQEVAETELRLFLARELSKLPVTNSRERREATRRIMRRIRQHHTERQRKVNGL